MVKIYLISPYSRVGVSGIIGSWDAEKGYFKWEESGGILETLGLEDISVYIRQRKEALQKPVDEDVYERLYADMECH